MKQRHLIITVLFIFSVLLLHLPGSCLALDCGNSDMSGDNNCLFYGSMGVAGGTISSANNSLFTANMYPYQQVFGVGNWHGEAVQALADGRDFRDSNLLLLGVVVDSTTPQGQMLLDPNLNYEDVDLITFVGEDGDGIPDTFILPENIDQRLLSAIATFGYEACTGSDPDGEANLREAIRLLTNIYLMIGDEFLIDALEWRFSSDTLGMEAKLDEQLLLLAKGRLLHDAAVAAFVQGFSMHVGDTCHISDYFDPVIFNLFHIAVDRASTTMRETTSKKLARQIAPGTADSAMSQSGSLLRESYTATYLATAAAAQKEALEFLNNGGDRLYTALKSLQQQAGIYFGTLNPLGFDDRYIPMQDYNPTLKGRAEAALTIAEQSKSIFDAEDRLFDSNVDALKSVHHSIATNVFRNQLADLTGMDVADVTIGNINAVKQSGEDLYDCDPEDLDFQSCIDASAAGGVLKSKYSQIRTAQLRIDKAELQKKNILSAIEAENRRFNNQLRIEREDNGEVQDMLNEFLHKMKNARTKIKVHKRDKKKGKKTKSYETQYKLVDDPLQFDTDKAKKSQELLTEYRIKNAENNHEVTIMGMLRQVAEIDIEIDLAIEMYNSIVNDFDTAITQRDNLVFSFEKSMEYYNDSEETIKNKITESRIMRSEAALNLTRDKNRAVHRTYLAAKALEFKYLKPLENISMGGGETLDIQDLYKIQTPGDLQTFQDSLANYDTCAWGSVNARLYRISFARDVLGLTDAYLEETYNVFTYGEKAQKRQELLQGYLNSKLDIEWNELSLNFSISLTDEVIKRYHKYNTKIWWGNASPPCDPVEAKGVTVLITTNQTASLEPYVTLTMKGTQTFLNRDSEIVEYVPVSEYLNMQVADTDNTLITKGSFDAFINEDPDAASLHEWTNSFKGRSIASANWSLVIEDFSYPYDLDWSKVTDIIIYMDTMGNELP